MFAFGPVRSRKRPSLTPMIDVVFLLLVFFMLAARFGAEGAVAMATGGGSAVWQGAPRLVEFAPGAYWLNGAPIAADALPAGLRALMPDLDAPIVLRPRLGADAQALIDLSERLRDAGLTRLIVIEGD